MATIRNIIVSFYNDAGAQKVCSMQVAQGHDQPDREVAAYAAEACLSRLPLTVQAHDNIGVFVNTGAACFNGRMEANTPTGLRGPATARFDEPAAKA